MFQVPGDVNDVFLFNSSNDSTDIEVMITFMRAVTMMETKENDITDKTKVEQKSFSVRNERCPFAHPIVSRTFTLKSIVCTVLHVFGMYLTSS